MLEEIRIRGLGAIDDAVLELGPGLNVLTGETGAGKTMVVTGLGLLLGSRSDAGAVRAGHDKASVEGWIRVDAAGPVAAHAAEVDAEADGELVISRTVSSDGRSRAYVGGRAVPVSVLGQLADHLAVVVGQGDQRRLLLPARQRAALDRFAGEAVGTTVPAYVRRYERLRLVEDERRVVSTRARERAQEADLLRFGLTEIERVRPQAGEDAELAADEERLAHADALRSAAYSAHAALAGEDGGDGTEALALVSAARRALEVQREHDPAVAGLAERLAEVSYLLADIAADLASYATSIDADPARLAAVQQRRATLTALTRKYGENAAEVLDWAERAARRLAELEGDDERLVALRTECETLRTELAELAGRLSAARHAAAEPFAAAIAAELAALALPHAQVVVDVRPRPDAAGLPVDGTVVAFGPTGVDEVEILFAAHPGAAPRPLDRGASGGELSRVMLAVEVVFAGADPVPTVVFDEVDAGVGGKAAVELGRRLAKLARSAQVLVVTHLPQVAAFADRHLRVAKSDDGVVTRTGVSVLDDEGRVQELSRMLAGLEGSATARAHAAELLATATMSKAGTG